MWRLALVALFALATPMLALAQPLSETAATNAAHSRWRELLEISEPARRALSSAAEQAGTVISANEADRRPRAEEFAAGADQARAALNLALRRLQALDAFPDTPTDPNLADLVRSHQATAVQGLQASLEILERLERIIRAFANGHTQIVVNEGDALVSASIALARTTANESRIRARLSPEIPWVEPMDNASAELIDGMASLIELRVASTEQQPAVRASLRTHADRIRAFVDTATNAIATGESDSQLSVALSTLRPALIERGNWLQQAANELEGAAATSDTADLRARLLAVRTLHRQIVTSQQAALR